MFSSFSFLRYGHQTADIKPFPKLTSARLFSQEPRKKLFLRRHEASLKIFEDKTCKVPIKSSFFADFVSLVKTLFISTSALSYGDKAWPIFALGGLAIWPRRISKKRTGETGTLSWPKLGKNFQACNVLSVCFEKIMKQPTRRRVYRPRLSICLKYVRLRKRFFSSKMQKKKKNGLGKKSVTDPVESMSLQGSRRKRHLAGSFFTFFFLVVYMYLP